jgi:hypothetical protein
MQDYSWKNEEYRQLRAVTVLAFIPGFSLLLPAGIRSSHALPAMGIAPLAFSACQGVLILTGRLQLASKKALIDLFLAFWCLGAWQFRILDDVRTTRLTGFAL